MLGPNNRIEMGDVKTQSGHDEMGNIQVTGIVGHVEKDRIGVIGGRHSNL